MSKENDRALRIYNEVFGLERLHYGIWLPEDELTTEKLKIAQERYENYLVENIPDGVSNILDVGCGTGILVKKLIGLGYDVEGLSPDITQKINFEKNINAIFYHSIFDKFFNDDHYDCVIMSESAQYINLEYIFKNSERCLKKGGYLMICDYFSLPNSSGEISKSSHNYDEFKTFLNDSKFSVISESDITESVTKTLDLSKEMIGKVYKAVEIGTEKTRTKHPHISKFVLWLFKNKIDGLKRKAQLSSAEEFKLKKTYRFMLLQMKS